jgi:short-subunit dehydrogenase
VNLGGRTALVTGATGGLGQAIARALDRRGAQLILSGRREDVLSSLAASLGGSGGAARVVVCDLAVRSDVARLADEAADADVLVANAGVPASGVLPSLSVDAMDRALEVDLRAPMVLARLLADGMAARGGGHVVFVNSTSGKTGTVGQSVYCAAKFGLRGYAQGIREDLRPLGVGVSSVFPSFIRDAGMFHDSGARLPFYVGTRTPDDVAAAVIRAIEHDRSEIDVAPLGLRLGSAIQGVAPELAARVQRRLGADKIAARVAAGQRDKA